MNFNISPLPQKGDFELEITCFGEKIFELQNVTYSEAERVACYIIISNKLRFGIPEISHDTLIRRMKGGAKS